VIERNRLAVLATQLKGQPHTSLIAFTPLEGLRFLAFATYRYTLKYKSILDDPRVAILIEDREGDTTRRSDQRLFLTALGEVIKTPAEDRQVHIMTHLARHPNLEEFLVKPDCEFVHVGIHAYQVVSGIDDVQWYKIGKSAAT
jgi:hypothetical protein